ncbi:MAG: FecR domain-containing protein [Gemmatimonadota bacterium]|jgi:transmembrane sensor
MTQEPADPFNPAEPETWEALARYLSGESDAGESEEIRAWLDREPARAELVEALDRSMRGLERPAPADLDVAAALRAVRSRFDEPEVLPLRPRGARGRERGIPLWRRTGLRIAASVVLVLGALAVWRAVSGPESGAAPAAALAFATQVGQVDSVRLPDGTGVILGPGSRLQLAEVYGTAARVAELAGEAVFDVRHDAARPFTVRAGNATIRDLGTRFAVRTDDGEGVHVVVTEGSVLLNEAMAEEANGVILRAGDRGALDAAGAIRTEPGAVTDADLAWTRGGLVFEDATLLHVMADLRRWYGVELQVGDPSLASRHITATFEGEPIDQVLNVIGLALGARIVQRGDTAIIQPEPGGT